MTKLADIELSKFNTQLFDWTVEQIYTIIEFLQRMSEKSIQKNSQFFFKNKKLFRGKFHDRERLKNNGKERVTYGYSHRYTAWSVEYKL